MLLIHNPEGHRNLHRLTGLPQPNQQGNYTLLVFYNRRGFMFTLYFDGLYRETNRTSLSGHDRNIMCYGWLIFDNGKVIARGYGSYTHREYASSLGAEFLALIKGMEAFRDMGLHNKPLLIIGDAKSIILQMQGLASVSSLRVKPLFNQAMRIRRNLKNPQWRWVPREQNKAADQMSRNALRQVALIRKEDILPQKSSGFQMIYDFMVSQKSGYQII